ncbi:hypothetical protein T06_1894 [Trichinella sp. T6]|nr:hypothetical protein T06_1894 [Trichinella sp. T6]
MPYVHMRIPYFKLDGCGPLRTTCCPSLRKQLAFVAEANSLCFNKIKDRADLRAFSSYNPVMTLDNG